jgi:Na+-transporting methylmalonyl-CoA/oxaloacetate decarboxylase gamma subunit
MFLLILVVLLYVCVDFGGSYAKEPPKSTQTYKRTTKINKNIQKNHQNQQKHTQDTPKSTQTYKRTTKIDFGGSFVCLC